MKRNLILGLTFLSLIMLMFSFSKSKFAKVENFRIYYGGVNKAILEDIRNYDLVIVEGENFSDADVGFVQSSNTILMGYISVMEISSWDKSLVDKLSDSDYLRINDKRVRNDKYQNYLGDISQEHYQSVLLDTLEKRIISKGMEGVFLDTLDWIDEYKTNKVAYNKLLKGYETFLKRVRLKYPKIIILQNRGFNAFEDMSYNYIDGLLWENFRAPSLDGKDVAFNRLRIIEEKRKKKDLAIFTVSFMSKKENEKFSLERGFKYLYLNKDARYTKWKFKE